MKLTALFALTLALSACDKPAPSDTVQTLANSPARLKELRAQCKQGRSQVGDDACNAVSEATRRRFMGTGTPYTSGPAAGTAEGADEGKGSK